MGGLPSKYPLLFNRCAHSAGPGHWFVDSLINGLIHGFIHGSSGEIKKRMEQLEHAQISLEREKGRLERELADARASRDEAREMMHDLESSLSEARDERSELHREIDDMTSKVRTAESGMDEAATLSNRLAKRVSEL